MKRYEVRFAPIEGERWLPVRGLEELYEVSDFGRIKSLKNHRGNVRKHPIVLTPSLRGRPGAKYPSCSLAGRKNKRVHRLVLEAFVGGCPPGMESAHLDGNPQNSRLDNLQWATAKENARHRCEIHKTHFRGSQVTVSKLDETDIPIIRALGGKMSQMNIGKIFGVSQMVIQKILVGKIWRHVP